ncbi:GNAT family N-acetyltransferase [Roseateles terrae]|uniref:Ribosomal protein S18 acetylase RimI-like enzyme n=1 Tax=Roseateles terrae TaxID=431060 RepID=A0ABR6GXD7_9BURK|nr:N-acetyltransferase [Roseateles terrae]MBB3196770.1 ribosomal protein S18 acetylase RimI-like enzyme [Roseateles terrae]
MHAAASPRETRVDGWLIRLSPGKARRSRCVNALGSTGELPLDDLIVRCRRSFEQAGLPVLFRITPFSQPAALDDWLDARGWRAFDPTDVQVLPHLDHLVPTSSGATLQAMSADAYATLVGSQRGSSQEEILGHAERLKTAPVRHQAFCLQQPNGEPLAYGQIALDGTLAGLFDIVTVAAHRGQGWGRTLCTELLLEARRQGALEAYLQVAVDNAPAQALYAGLGFQRAYRYHYRSDDPRTWPEGV